MTQHRHRERVEGCFRCELSKDEVQYEACDECDLLGYKTCDCDA